MASEKYVARLRRWGRNRRIYERLNTPLEHLRHAAARLAEDATKDDHTSRDATAGRVARIVEALALVLARGDGDPQAHKAVLAFDAVARKFLKTKGKREHAHPYAVLARRDAKRVLLKMAKMALNAQVALPGSKVKGRDPSPEESAAMAANFLGDALARLALVRDEDLEERNGVFAEAFKRARGRRETFDEEAVVRLALLKYGVVRTHQEAGDWMKSID